jgi:hypothetical protein
MKPFVVVYESEGRRDYEGDFDTLASALAHIAMSDEDVRKEHDLCCNEKVWSFHVFELKKSYSAKLEISRSFKSWEEEQ